MTNPVQELGWRTTRFAAAVGAMTRFGLRLTSALVRPPFRARAFVEELYKLGVLSIVIIGVCGFAVGMVLGLQGYNTLERFGATGSLGAVVGLGLVRELGPVLTALLFAGRAGSATTAELGAMVTTEQLDGLRMLSIDPVHLVVAPRALAMVVVMPMLSALFILTGFAGGYVVAVWVMGGDGGVYRSSLLDAVEFHDDVSGSLVKALAFGALVGLIATYRGFTCRPNAAGVSAATTSTVVLSSVSVLICDYVITALWSIQ